MFKLPIRSRPACSPERFRPSVETLGERLVPAVFTVTLATDTGSLTSTSIPLGTGTAGDLRHAIFQADLTPGAQTSST